jgi:hypothetical protein
MIPSTNTKLLVAEDWKKVYQSFKNADFKSYDFETLKRVMISYLRENYPEEFNDFIDSSEYIALIDLIAYLGQNLSFRIDLNARENFLETAERRESILRLAQLISYNPARNVPANGFLKVTAISTTDNVFDANGVNLANTVIAWNDPTNQDWYQQFVNIMNSAMTTAFGNPVDRDTISGALTERYVVNSSNNDVPIFNFSKVINGVSMNFEIVPCTFTGESYIYEDSPAPGKSFSLIYKNDNQGSASPNTGFLVHFRQGTLSLANFSLDNPVPNEIVGVNTPNINNSDVWLWQLDKNGNYSTLWTQVPALLGNNVIYNSLNQSLRSIYAVSTRNDDQIDLNFADGVFGDLPKGDFRLFYRQSNGLSYIIKPEQMSGVVITIPYFNSFGQSQELQLTLSLEYTVSNSAGPESNASIQLKAPQLYYTQNRMITGEDYNISPLNAGSDILKVKSINRISSGLSKYFDISDVTGKYSQTNIFADDGILYKEEIEEFFEFDFASRSQILSVIKNQLAPIVNSSKLKNFYLDKYSKIDLAYLGIRWTEVNKIPNESRGYFNLGSQVFSVGTFSISNLKYITPGALVKFIAPTGKYFDDNNNIKTIPTSNIIPSGGKIYFWSMVKQVVLDGSNGGLGALDDGTGPIIFSTKIPGDGTNSNSAIPTEVIPKYNNLLSFGLENEISNFCLGQRNFGLTIDSVSREWQFILNSNLNLQDAFSLANQNNIEDIGLDSSWIISFVWTGKKYKVTYRTLNFVFESNQKTAFFVDNSSVNYNFNDNTVLKDKINVLSVNSVPTGIPKWFGGPTNPSNTIGQDGSYYLNTTNGTIFQKMSGVWVQSSNITGELGNDFLWQIESPTIEKDGYVNPRKVKINFYDFNTLGQIEDPDSFDKIVGDNKFVYFKLDSDGIYRLTTDVRDAIESEDNWNSYLLNPINQPINNGDLFYFYNPNENVVKKWSTETSTLIFDENYIGRSGRADLKFQYTHNSGNNRRIDPSKSNIIDIYLLTVSYDNEFRQYLSGVVNQEPLAPTTQSLEQNYKSKLDNIKSISDEIIFHPVKYKILFGEKADPNLQATFKAVKNNERLITDNDIKTKILNAINEFFSLENWEFGQTFYFSELSTYVMNKLTPDITNFVIVPKGNSGFGSFYEISSQPNELFIHSVSINDIEVISAITASQLKSSSNIVTSSGT